MNLVDDVDFEFAARRETDVIAKFANLVDAIVARAVDLKHVEADSCDISLQESQTPHGLMVGPCTQFTALAKMRAVEVLPVPRGPTKR